MVVLKIASAVGVLKMTVWLYTATMLSEILETNGWWFLSTFWDEHEP